MHWLSRPPNRICTQSSPSPSISTPETAIALRKDRARAALVPGVRLPRCRLGLRRQHSDGPAGVGLTAVDEDEFCPVAELASQLFLALEVAQDALDAGGAAELDDDRLALAVGGEVEGDALGVAQGEVRGVVADGGLQPVEADRLRIAFDVDPAGGSDGEQQATGQSQGQEAARGEDRHEQSTRRVTFSGMMNNI